MSGQTGYSTGRELTADQIAAVRAATAPTGANAFVTVSALPPAAALTADQVAGIAASTTPITAANPAVSTADLPVDPTFPADALTADEVAGIAAAPTAITAANPAASVADLIPGVAGPGRAVLVNVVNPTAGSTVAVHANFDDAALLFPGPYTAPDVPRTLTITSDGTWDRGNVDLVGTNPHGAVAETIIIAPGTTQETVNAYSTLTSATKTAVGTAGGATIGTGDKCFLNHTALPAGTVIEAFGMGVGGAMGTGFRATITPAKFLTTLAAGTNANGDNRVLVNVVP